MKAAGAKSTERAQGKDSNKSAGAQMGDSREAQTVADSRELDRREAQTVDSRESAPRQ